MELRHLRYFVAAAEAENVSRAALKLHVSQPALSRQIRDLEEELRFELFERSAKSVRLTDAGREFLAQARAVLQRADEAVQAGREVAGGGRGEIQVGYAPSPTVRLLPAALRAFQARLPKVRVRLHDLSTEEMIAGVRAGSLHLALLVRPNRAMLRGLIFQELVRDTMCLAVPPNHARARARSIPLTAVTTEPLVVFSRSQYPEYVEYLEKLFGTVKARPRIAEEHDGAASLITAIESGAGVAVLPQSFSCTSGPRLSLVPLTPSPEPLVVGAVWSKSNSTPSVQTFLEAAEEAAKA